MTARERERYRKHVEEPFKFLKQTCNGNHGGADHEAVQSVGKARKALKEQEVTREQVGHSATSGKLFVVALALLGVLGCAGWWVSCKWNILNV